MVVVDVLGSVVVVVVEVVVVVGSVVVDESVAAVVVVELLPSVSSCSSAVHFEARLSRTYSFDLSPLLNPMRCH